MLARFLKEGLMCIMSWGKTWSGWKDVIFNSSNKSSIYIIVYVLHLT